MHDIIYIIIVDPKRQTGPNYTVLVNLVSKVKPDPKLPLNAKRTHFILFWSI